MTLKVKGESGKSEPHDTMINSARYRPILNLFAIYSSLAWGGEGHDFLAAFGGCEAPFCPEPGGSAFCDD